ncbi:hypothetical protein [Aeromonas veronii]|uniref:hypothetical protein n=1 Tax=Aeromonas veronii TaxID=654 RepID=UPI003B9E837F
MKIDIDNLTGTENLDELEAMLEEIEAEGDHELQHDTTIEKIDEEAASSAVDVVASQDQNRVGQDSEEVGAPEKVISAKSGQHTIPYEVLEQARHENKQLREQLTQSQQAQVERDRLQALLEVHGISPDTDPDQISQEELTQLAQDYPEIGKTLLTMARKLQRLEQPVVAPPSQPVADPVQTALEAVPDLMAWRDSDPDRFDFAISVDDKLMANPEWKGKSLAVRFAEAARRTKVAFGDEQESDSQPSEKAAKVVEPSADFIPSSPSALGQTHHAAETGVARYGAMSQTELVGEMGAMTDAQLEALLEEAGY